MEALLSTKQSHSCMDWLRLIHRNDPDEQYIIAEVSHYKQQSSWPAMQTEYLTLLVHPPPNQPLAPVLIKVSRDVRGTVHPSRYRLCGPTDDKVSVLGPAGDVQLDNQRLHHLTWSPEEAPSLKKIGCIIACCHYHIPQCSLGLERCCYAFVHAVLQAIHIGCNGMPGTVKPLLLIPDTLLVHTFRWGASPTDRVFDSVSIQSEIFDEGGERVEEILQRPLLLPSCLAYVFPVGIMDVRQMARAVGSGYASRVYVYGRQNRAEVL